MNEALLWGFLSTVSLMIGAAVALYFKLSNKTIGLVTALGVGALISSVSFDLVEEAFSESQTIWVVIAGMALGSLVYLIGDLLIRRFGGGDRKNYTGADSENSGLAILLGIILDGIPESIAIGMTIVTGGGVSVVMILAVFLSNVPEALSSSTGLLASGWKKRNIISLWLIVMVISILSTLVGYLLFADSSVLLRVSILSFASGAILTMLANTMIPEAYRDSGILTGLFVMIGFCLALAIGALN